MAALRSVRTNSISNGKTRSPVPQTKAWTEPVDPLPHPGSHHQTGNRAETHDTTGLVDVPTQEIDPTSVVGDHGICENEANIADPYGDEFTIVESVF